MIQIIREYRIREDHAEPFDFFFGSSGAWAELLRQSPDYWGTTLLRDSADPLRRVVIDQWSEPDAQAHLKIAAAEQFANVTALCATLIESETELGTFTVA